MIDMASIVKLSPRARLRFDRHADQHVLLYPERGLLLNGSAAEVVHECIESRSVHAIVERLTAKYGEPRRASIMEDVLTLLRELANRGLLRELDPLESSCAHE